MTTIKISIKTVDHFSQTRKFQTVEGARKYARRYVGQFPDVGGSYAVSQDGIVTAHVDGMDLNEFFYPQASPSELDEAYAGWSCADCDGACRNARCAAVHRAQAEQYAREQNAREAEAAREASRKPCDQCAHRNTDRCPGRDCDALESWLCMF
jgi:hypothetical protein